MILVLSMLKKGPPESAECAVVVGNYCKGAGEDGSNGAGTDYDV